MRHLIITISFCAMITSVKAQKLNFCEALPMIEKNTVEEFVDIRKEVDNTVKYPTTYFSSIQILEAKTSRIVKNNHGYSFKADFGSFSTKAEAQKKMNALQAALKSCYPELHTSFSTDMLKTTEYQSFYALSENGLRLYSARFKLQTLSGKSELSFEFDANENKSTLNENPKKAFYDFGLIKSNLSYDDFSVALRNVIEEAKTGFKAIMGTQSDYGRGFVSYRTKYFIPGYSSFIEDRTMGVVYYVVPTFQRVTAQTFATNAEKAQKMIQSALGNNYGYRTTEDGKAQFYVHKNHPDKPVVELVLKEKNGEFVFELYVKSLE
jgi:hypothetical protein